MARRRKPPRAGALSELQPLKIATQIATLQALYYTTAGILMLFTALVAGMSFSVDMILGWDAVRGDTTQGWLLSFIWLIDGGLCMAVAIVVLIARSKLVPDFALTIHLLHLVFTTLYARSLPRHSMWWMTMMASAAVAVALGMWGCRYRELQPVFFGGGRILGSNSAPAAASHGQVAAEEGQAGLDDDDDDGRGGAEDDGFSRGRGRGRGKDGAGEYEMVGMKQAKD
ncbi:Protein SYS1 [Metarhizium brunneum]|uniref:Protein SYS1 n=1 Tax=Metarhizium brunneum TaxID=500148 RepID=A0A7D5UX94_9HYPO